MRYLFLLLLIGWASISFSQDEVLSKIPKKGTAINTFIPEGYDTLEVARGDLDKDGVQDIAMVLRDKREELDGQTELPNRILVIVFKKGSSFELKAVSDSAVLCKECGGIFGDPFAEITIKNGLLTIQHYGGSAWRWDYTHKFRYQQDGFYLIGKTSHYYWNVKMCDKLKDFAGTTYEDVNLITGGFESKKISEECKLLENKKGKKPKTALIKLEQFSIENSM